MTVWPISPSPCRASAPARSRCSATTAQRAQWLPKTRAGKAIAAFALTEPASGSDVANIATAARRDGDAFVLDGEKTWISNGGIADLYVVFARTGEAPGARGLSAFIVEGDNPGLTIAERIAVIAPHPLARLRFENCRVPASAMIGKPGEGFKIAMATLDVFRTTVGAAALGFARRALVETAKRARRAQAVRRADGELQMVQGHLADMALEIDAAALLVYRAAWTKDVGAARVTREAAMAKLYATEAAQRVIDTAVQLHGGDGVRSGHPGRDALPRNPGAAHLRGRVRCPEDHHCPVGPVGNFGSRNMSKQNRRSVRPRMSTPSRATTCRRSSSGRTSCSTGRNSNIPSGSTPASN